MGVGSEWVMLSESKNKQYSYLGHIIESQIDFPELCLADKTHGSASVYIRLDELAIGADGRYDWCHHWETADGITTLSLAKNKNRYSLEVPGSARFEISGDGKQLLCTPKSSTPLFVTRHLLLNQILPRLFAHFYNYNVFHGSCVIKKKGTGICFLGETGKGKSTLAAGFLKAGYSVLTDDCIQMYVKSGGVFGVPSYTGVRLLNDSLAALNFEESYQERVSSIVNEKSRITLSHPEISTTKIQEIFFLADPHDDEKGGDIERIEVSKSIAVKELLRNSFSLDISDPRYLKHQLLQIVSLVSTDIPICCLRYPRSYNAIPDIIRAVERV